MRTTITAIIRDFLYAHPAPDGDGNLWEEPLVRFADARSGEVERLKEVVVDSHHMPWDFLPNARNILSYFLPFKRDIARSNIKNRLASGLWARAYLQTNETAAKCNAHLVKKIETMGFKAAVPRDAGIISETVLKSRWSQRHVAWLAGHGTFGLNNMLITEKGSCGRYFSIVTTLPVEPDAIVTEQRCGFYRDGSCGVCAARCVGKALKPGFFDRDACYRLCLENEAITPGADVCGKCTVGLPCSFACP